MQRWMGWSLLLAAKSIHRLRIYVKQSESKSSDKSINLIEISARKKHVKCCRSLVRALFRWITGGHFDNISINVIYFLSKKSAFHFDFLSVMTMMMREGEMRIEIFPRLSQEISTDSDRGSNLSTFPYWVSSPYYVCIRKHQHCNKKHRKICLDSNFLSFFTAIFSQPPLHCLLFSRFSSSHRSKCKFYDYGVENMFLGSLSPLKCLTDVSIVCYSFMSWGERRRFSRSW